MRPIRFRAWNLVKQEMIYNPIVCGIGFFKDEYVGINDFFNSKFPKAKLEIMQFTGLKDIHDKDIYESDLLRITSERPAKGAVIQVIWHEHEAGWHEWFDRKFYQELNRAGILVNGFEVIGNIWEEQKRDKDGAL